MQRPVNLCWSKSVRSIASFGEVELRPNLVKIDVEGGEGVVLEGMKRTLREASPIVLCEMHPDNPDGVSRAFAALSSAGYLCRNLESDDQRSDATRNDSHLPHSC